MAGSIGVRIQQLGREDALRKIYQMKGFAPPQQMAASVSPKSSPRGSSDSS